VNRLCIHGKDFAGLVGKHDGWHMVNEGSQVKPKWGFVTKQVSQRSCYYHAVPCMNPKPSHQGVGPGGGGKDVVQ
jgi:hypothetical protein